MSRSRSRILDPVFKAGGATSPKGNITMLFVIMVSVVILRVIMHSVVVLSAFILSVILSVSMQSVVSL